jgi:hypothetical protein
MVEKHMANIIGAMKGLITLFRPHCQDQTTLDELTTLIEDKAKWRRGHDLFGRIRKKMLAADRAHDQRLIAQYAFEEVCAKTLYNLSGEPGPFDRDVPFRIVPNAILFGRALDVPDLEVVRAIMS